MTTPEDVLSFWFPPGVGDTFDAHFAQFSLWFRGGEAFDAAIYERFGSTWAAAVRGDFDHWAETPRGRLALVLVLDQFSRNIARGTPMAYAQDERAQALALVAIETGMTAEMATWEAQFFVVALAHSEDLALHDAAVAFIERLVEERTPAHLLDFYRKTLRQPRGHRDVIRRFGRHPQRNAVLGRTSTPEELAYLAGEPVHAANIRRFL